MLEPAITLDADMPAGEALARLSQLGHWAEPHEPSAHARISSFATRLNITFDEAAQRLARDPRHLHIALRRQWDDRVLWYALPLREVLNACTAAPAGMPLLSVLQLHETDSAPPVEAANLSQQPSAHGVVLDQGVPVGVAVPTPRMQTAPAAEPQPLPTGPKVGGMKIQSMPRNSDQVTLSAGAPNEGLIGRGLKAVRNAIGLGRGPVGRPPPQRAPEAPPEPPPAPVTTWPRLDAPPFVQAEQVFEVVVGFARTQQAGVSGGAVTLPSRRQHDTLDLTVELIAHGLDAPQGWSRPLKVTLADPTTAEARFQLVGRLPEANQGMTLATLDVRYVLDGTVCGTASRPLVITRGAAEASDRPFGQAWVAQPTTQSVVDLRGDAQAPDLTVEILKPDRNAATGRYVCKLYSPHPLTADTGPHEMDLGHDAKTFAKQLVDEVRQFSGNVLIDTTLEAAGRAVAERLPPAVFEALAEVAARCAPAVPAVLVVSAEPYVPWELAWLDTPLDATRPPYLGAQALVGRWLREGGVAATPKPGVVTQRPPTQPLARMKVAHMAVMAGLYKAESGLRRLPKAEDEAQQLATAYKTKTLPATPKDIKQLIDAKLAPGVQAVHFAGHGDFDPSQPDSAALFLEDGSPLKSMLFRAANYGGDNQPLIFLNACMIGVGGELLGDMGGFPGNCLRGGFGGLLGALWEIDDTVAHDVALEFWRRALPEAPTQPEPEPVAAILRDLRAKYAATTPEGLPVHTYLAYVYYGHPRLTLARAA